jgi:hypothetical protein
MNQHPRSCRNILGRLESWDNGADRIRVGRGVTLDHWSRLKTRTKSVPSEWWLLLAVYLGTRLVNPTVLPVFCDEAIHIHAVQHLDLAQDLFSPLQHGSPKLVLDWVTAVSLALLPDPVVSARLASVGAGALGMLGVYLVGKHLYSARIGALAAALYVISPLMLFHERMLLADVVLNTCGLYVLLFSLLCLSDGRFIYSVALGATIALAVLSKLPGIFFLITPFLVWALVHRIKAGALAMRLCPAYCTTALILAPVLLHPLGPRLFLELARKTIGTSDALTISGWMGLFVANGRAALPSLGAYLTSPVVAMCGFSVALALALKSEQGVLLWAMAAIPVFALIGSSSGFLPPRYSLFCVSPVFPCVAWSIEQVSRATPPLLGRMSMFRNRPSLRSRAALGVLLSMLALLSFQAARLDYYFVTDPSRASLPALDRWQYIEGWPSGYGIPQAVGWLQNRASQEDLSVITDPNDTIPLDGVLIYLHDDPRVRAYGEDLSEPVRANALGTEAFVVLDSIPHPDFAMLNPSADLVARFPKPGGQSAIEVYSLPKDLTVRQLSVVTVEDSIAGTVAVGDFRAPEWGEDRPGKLIWLGEGDEQGIAAVLGSDGQRTVELAFDVRPGPGRDDALRTVELNVENQAGTQTERQRFDRPTTISFAVNLQVGRNELSFRCLDEPTVLVQPNGDTRPLLLRLDAIRVASVFDQAQAGPPDSPLVTVDPALRGVVGLLSHLETPPWSIELDGEDSFLWLGQGDEEGIRATLWSAEEKSVDLAVDVAPGPGRPDALRNVYLTLENESGVYRQEKTLDAPTTLHFAVRLEAGPNDLIFGCLDEATLLDQPSGDTRPLLVLLRGIRIAP